MPQYSQDKKRKYLINVILQAHEYINANFDALTDDELMALALKIERQRIFEAKNRLRKK